MIYSRNYVDTFPSLLCPSVLLKFDQTSINLLSIRQFHQKQNDLKRRWLLKPKKGRKHNQQYNYEKDSTFSQVFWTISYASAVS